MPASRNAKPSRHHSKRVSRKRNVCNPRKEVSVAVCNMGYPLKRFNALNDFNSLVLEIIDVAGSRIRFVVASDGGLPWLPG